MAKYIVHGGNELHGEIIVNSGKNSPIALLCGALMIKGNTRFIGMTKVSDVIDLLEVFTSIGAKATWEDDQTLLLDTSADFNMAAIDKEKCAKMRISLLFMGALANREKQFKVYKSGGCKLGKRSIRPHTLALEAYGIEVSSHEEYYEVNANELTGADIVMDESGDTATENAIMGAIFAKGESIIKMASANYMVQDLCYFLNAAGANIKGIGTTTLRITGVESLSSVDAYYPIPDPVDAMAWISLAITTKSTLTIKNCPLAFLELELQKLQHMGQQFDITNKRPSQSGHFTLIDITVKPSTLTALSDKIYGRPYPGLNIDNVPLFMPILTQAKGTTLVHDWCYENRALYGLELQKLGAKVMLLDPHRLLIEGTSELKGNEVMAPPAIRPAMAILITMIAAKGTSILRQVYPIERAYDGLIGRLQSIGVNITREE